MPASGLSFLLFLSGAAALLVEVSLSRALVFVVGNSTLAVTSILVAFMGGIGIGSLAGGRLARGIDGARALRRFALLETATALLGPLAFAAARALGASRL